MQAFDYIIIYFSFVHRTEGKNAVLALCFTYTADMHFIFVSQVKYESTLQADATSYTVSIITENPFPWRTCMKNSNSVDSQFSGMVLL